MFLQVSVILSTGGCAWLGGACMVARGSMHGCWGVAGMVAGGCVAARGHVWLLGGMHGCQGACMAAGGHAWLPGGVWLPGGHVWLSGGMCGCRGACMVTRGHVWLWGACMVARGHAWLLGGVACIGYDEIRSMSGRYASYWNAFLFSLPSELESESGNVNKP